MQIHSQGKPARAGASGKGAAKGGPGKGPALPAQRQSLYRNATGIPDAMKEKYEAGSGLSLDDVRVHYNSQEPARLQALAYTRGSQVYIAPGQERHLGHELGHVVQQKAGRVRATGVINGQPVNDDRALEREADRAAAGGPLPAGGTGTAPAGSPVQRLPDLAQVYLKRLRKQLGHPGQVWEQLLIMEDMQNVQRVGAPVQAAARALLLPIATQALYNNVVAAGVAASGRPPAMAVYERNRIIGLAGSNDPIALFRYMMNLTHVNQVGPPIANQAFLQLPPLLTAPMRDGMLAAALATPMGQYAADTAHNALLTGVLTAHPFIFAATNGAFQGATPGAVGSPSAPGAVTVPNVTDDRVRAAADLFNRLTNLTAALPPVTEQPIWGPHASMGGGTLQVGWAATRGNLVHEFGHHLEDNLSPADFITLHRFLTARTRVPAPGAAVPAAGVGMRESGYFFEHHPGYDIDMPPINAGIWANFTQATPLRYIGMVGRGIWNELGRLLTFVSRRRGPREHMSGPLNNFYVHNANNPKLSYSTAVHRYAAHPHRGSTEYLSTTTEFFNNPAHITELVNQDPLRVALFLYLANRPVYAQVAAAFNAAAAAAAVPPAVAPTLDELIHVL